MGPLEPMVKSGVKFRWRKTATVTLTSTPSQHSAAPGDWPKLNGANLDSLPEKVSWARLWADGVTPRKGVVLAMQDYGAVIAISQTQKGLVPASATSASELAQLARGAPVMVYITSKSFDTQKFNLALTPSAEPSQRLFRMKCDGRHPYSGVVSSIADFGYFVDVGSGCRKSSNMFNCSGRKSWTLLTLRMTSRTDSCSTALQSESEKGCLTRLSKSAQCTILISVSFLTWELCQFACTICQTE